MTSETAADDGASVGYLMQRWAVSWRSGAVLALIVTSAEMRGVLDVDLDVDVDVAMAQSRAMYGQDSM